MRNPPQHAFEHGKPPLTALDPRLLSHDPTVAVRSDNGHRHCACPPPSTKLALAFGIFDAAWK
jgi:hypothetical protein